MPELNERALILNVIGTTAYYSNPCTLDLSTELHI